MRLVAIDRETPLVKVLDQASLHRATSLNRERRRPPSSAGCCGGTCAPAPRDREDEFVHVQQPIAEDGTLPWALWEAAQRQGPDRPQSALVPGLPIKDDLVTPACATAANKFLDGSKIVVESVAFYGGHVAS
ncbi:MAG: hypothetical protein U1E63_16340 [Burkholderiales bacterium]